MGVTIHEGLAEVLFYSGEMFFREKSAAFYIKAPAGIPDCLNKSDISSLVYSRRFPLWRLQGKQTLIKSGSGRERAGGGSGELANRKSSSPGLVIEFWNK